jgi:hypothetical protein
MRSKETGDRAAAASGREKRMGRRGRIRLFSFWPEKRAQALQTAAKLHCFPVSAQAAYSPFAACFLSIF